MAEVLFPRYDDGPYEGEDPRFAFEPQVRSWQAIFFSGRMP
jgi:hypothetical protein